MTALSRPCDLLQSRSPFRPTNRASHPAPSPPATPLPTCPRVPLPHCATPPLPTPPGRRTPGAICGARVASAARAPMPRTLPAAAASAPCAAPSPSARAPLPSTSLPPHSPPPPPPLPLQVLLGASGADQQLPTKVAGDGVARPAPRRDKVVFAPSPWTTVHPQLPSPWTFPPLANSSPGPSWDLMWQ